MSKPTSSKSKYTKSFLVCFCLLFLPLTSHYTSRSSFIFSYSFSVSFDLEALGGKAADHATPAEAINYFCDIRMEEELERARTRTREKTPVQAQDNSRNTVLVLPKIHRCVFALFQPGEDLYFVVEH